MARATHRRVRTDPAPGVDPAPQSLSSATEGEVELAGEDRLGAWSDDDGIVVRPDDGSESNAERLEGERPPHYA